MNIYKELLKLQRIEEAFDSWKDYRNEVTNCIVDNVDCFDDIVIFGAGSCNDIDLRIIEEKFEKVTLVDIDFHSMKEGIKQYSLENSKKIKLLKIDLLGIDESDYLNFSKVVEKTLQSQEPPLVDSTPVVKKLLEYTKKINNHKVRLGNNKFKNGVVIGLHSQLNIYFAQIWDMYCQALVKKDDLSVANQIINITFRQSIIRIIAL